MMLLVVSFVLFGVILLALLLIGTAHQDGVSEGFDAGWQAGWNAREAREEPQRGAHWDMLRPADRHGSSSEGGWPLDS